MTWSYTVPGVTGMTLRDVLRRRWLLLTAALVVVVAVVVAGVLVIVDRGEDGKPAASSGIDPEQVLDARQLKLIRDAIPDAECDSELPPAPAKGLVALEVLRVQGTCLRGTAEYLPADRIDARKKELSADPSVVVAAVPPTSTLDQDDDKRSDQWNLDMLGVPEKSTELPWPDGKGVVVAVIDTGVDASHPDLGGSVIARKNYPGQGALDPDGHGTHVAGIVGARRDNGGIVGVAPGVSILDVPVKLQEANEQAHSWFLGLPWAVNHGADVVNMSIGAPLPEDDATIQAGAAAVEFAEHNGVVVVASGGNCGGGIDEDCLQRNQREVPASYSPVLSVGALQSDFEIAGYSTRNKDVDLVAPGGGDELPPGQVLSTYPGGKYERMAGTSQAAPHVAAAAAIGRMVSREATTSALRRAILDSADVDRVAKDDRKDSGAGFLDVRGVVDELRENEPRPPVDLAKRTQVAYVQDDILSIFDGQASHPVRKLAGSLRWLDWSADHSTVFGADNQTLFTWAGPGTSRVETPCDWCADEYSSPAYVEDVVVTDPVGGKPTGDLVLRITPEGELTKYNAHTLEKVGSVRPVFPRDAVGSKSLHGVVGGRAIVHETGGAHALERLWLVNPASGEVSKSYTVRGSVPGAIAVNAARDRFAVLTSWSGSCGQPEGVQVLDKNLGKVAAPPPPAGVMFEELFFNGDTLYATMSRFTIAVGEGCRRSTAAGIWRVKGNAWSPFNADIDNARPLEGRADEPKTGWFVAEEGSAALRPPTKKEPLAGDLGPVSGFLWATPTRAELEKW